MLHVGEGEGRIDKVKTLCEALISNFQRNYLPGENLAVDETMVGFRGQFGPKQYMPNKPTKFGIKAFTLASSDHGYLLNLLLYVGAETLANADPAYAALPQPARVVMHLMEPYFSKGHHVYTDCYYSSILLAQALRQQHTKFTGTMIKNRVGLPDIIRSLSFKFQNDETRAFRDGSLLTVTWRAATKKKPLVMLTSSCPHEMVTVRSRCTTQQKPLVVDRYNHSMNGVDRADQYTVYYSFVRRSVKWWRKVFFWVMEVAIVNSYILHKCTAQRPLTHLEYRRSLVRSLQRMYSQLLHGYQVAGSAHANHNMVTQNSLTSSLTSWRGDHRGIVLFAGVSSLDTGTAQHTLTRPVLHTLHSVLLPVLKGTIPWRTTERHL